MQRHTYKDTLTNFGDQLASLKKTQRFKKIDNVAATVEALEVPLVFDACLNTRICFVLYMLS